MARTYDTALLELNDAREELESIFLMSKEEVCDLYNTDSKTEIVKVLHEEIDYLEKKVECLTPTVYEPEYDY